MMGPVSAKLEAELRDEVRKHGIVLFLDKDGTYTPFIDALVEQKKKEPPQEKTYPVCPFRGSFLELMLALENEAAGVDRTQVLVHLPGFNAEQVKASPLLELYEAGRSFQKAIGTLVTDAAAGKVRPEQIDAFRQTTTLTLEGADTWLSAKINDTGEGLAAQLVNVPLEALVDDLLGGGFIAGRLTNETDVEAVWQHCAKLSGLADAWRYNHESRALPRPRDIAFSLLSWCLVVEYVNDLTRPPIEQELAGMPRLPPAVIAACRRLAEHCRERQVDLYENTANETEARIASEKAVAAAKELGQIDTFQFEERVILAGALAALAESDYGAVLAWAEKRAAGKTFWTKQSPLRQSTWQFLCDAGRLGKSMADANTLGAVTSLDEAVAAYTTKGAVVDMHHRLFEQRRHTVLYPQNPYFEDLRKCFDDMRARWRAWADGWAREWNRVCKQHGFLPSPELQQRTLFDQVVKPLVSDGADHNEVTAYFNVDALRYEMAAELADALEETPGMQKTLKARLAELPSVTEVGMNVLAPVVENGRLKPALADGVIKGFGAGEYRVFDPATRKRAMFDRAGGKGCPWLDLADVLQWDAQRLKHQVAQARLLVVHSREIDNAGEKGVGTSVFDKVLQDLRAAWRLLREAGVRRFVITADHGFLLLDERMGEAQPHGRRIGLQRRHAFADDPIDRPGEARVALKDLGYDGVTGHVMFPETVTVFDNGKRSHSFVHGGNSPQERVIPVLTVVHKQAPGADGSNHYAVSAVSDVGVGGLHCLKARVTVVAKDSLFGGKKRVELGVRTVDGPNDVIVEIVATRGDARHAGSVIHADVGGSFEVFFRLLSNDDLRLQVELSATGGEPNVVGAVVDARFSTAPLLVVPVPAPAPTTPTKTLTIPTTTKTTKSPLAWLQDLPEGVRKVFQHITNHGTITELEIATMLGSPREARAFANKFDAHMARVPFRVRIETVGGIKRYVREVS